MKRNLFLAAVLLVAFCPLYARGSKYDRLAAKVDSLQAEVNRLKASNVLYGKKYVACGDSFTHKSWGPKAVEDGVHVYDTVAMTFKTYPYWIASRNEMELVNLAVSGATMTNWQNDRRRSFCLERYKEIPSDADYITLCFGINDSHKNAAVGDVEDTVDTTFCGAWNKVLSYIAENCPYAKVGIIITNGLDSNVYADATVRIARKWGIPYLDMVYGYNVPLMHRVRRPEVSPSVAARRMELFIVQENNKHPNLKAHIYQSTFIENFLRSL